MTCVSLPNVFFMKRIMHLSFVENKNKPEMCDGIMTIILQLVTSGFPLVNSKNSSKLIYRPNDRRGRNKKRFGVGVCTRGVGFGNICGVLISSMPNIRGRL